MRRHRSWSHEIGRFFCPGVAEADEEFRRELLDLSYFSLRAIAGLEVAGPAVMLGVRAAATAGVSVRAVVEIAALTAVGTFTFLLARTDWARRHARVAATVSLWSFGALLMLGSGGHLLAARVFGPGRFLPVYVVIIMLLAVAMLPLRPAQTLALGLALELVYLASAAGAQNPESAHHLFLIVLTVLSSAISAVIYQQRLATFASHQATLRATRRALLAEGSASAARLAAAVSHEFNSPLGALASSVDTLGTLAAKRAASPQGLPARLIELERQLMSAVKEATDRLSRTVARLQRVTNLDRAEERRIRIDDLLDDALATFNAQSVPEIRVDIVRECSGPGAPEVLCRPQQLNAVFLSLLNDRAAAAARGGGHIHILRTTGPERVEVQIRDDGPGIPPEEASRMFDLHFRAFDGRMAAANWSLFTGRQIVQEHGGELEIRSAGEGTTVTVSLPAASALEDEDAIIAASLN